jgi:hypothetical protein
VIAGSLLASRVRAPVLRGLFNLVLLATAFRMLVALPAGSVRQIAVEVPAAVTLCALGTLAGLASGMLGSGGGTFLVPALVVGFGLAQQVAQGTALLALIPIWVIGAVTHLRMHTLRLSEAAVVGLCGALTVPVGASESGGGRPAVAHHLRRLPVATVGRAGAHAPGNQTQPLSPRDTARSRGLTTSRSSRAGSGSQVGEPGLASRGPDTCCWPILPRSASSSLTLS